MAKFGGFGGNPMQMQNLMRQAQKMQQEAMEAEEEINQTELVGSAGGDMVKVTIKGNKDVVSVSINPNVVDPDDVAMLEDLVVAAFGDAFRKADELRNEKLGRFGNLGGLM